MTDQTTARARAVLRDVLRSGGKDRWSHLMSHGHNYATVRSCVKRGWLAEPMPYSYEVTFTGIQEAHAS